MQLVVVETTADRKGGTGELAFLAPAAAAALRLLAGAIQRGTDHDIVVQALNGAGVHEAFADVLDSASTAVMNGVDDLPLYARTSSGTAFVVASRQWQSSGDRPLSRSLISAMGARTGHCERDAARCRRPAHRSVQPQLPCKERRWHGFRRAETGGCFVGDRSVH
jgi:hypothetical protein